MKLDLPDLDGASSKADWALLTRTERRRAGQRAGALTDYHTGVSHGLTRRASAEAAGVVHEVSAASVARWAERGNTIFDAPRSGRPPRAFAGTGAEMAWAHYCADYLRLERPASAACYRRVQAMAQLHDWTIPSEASFRRRLRRDFSPAAIRRAREGVRGLIATRVFQTRSVAHLKPMEWLCGDGRTHDLFVIPPAEINPIRPVVWYWQDVYSRKLLAWRAGVTECADLVRLSLADTCATYGCPTHLLVDNTLAGRWFDTEDGVLVLLGVSVHRTGVERDAGGRAIGRAWAKPIERAFLDLAETIDKHPRAKGAYTGPNPHHKPENHQSRALAWDTFLELVEQGVTAHNARSGRRTETARGQSFDQVFAARFEADARRRITESQRALLLPSAPTTQVQPNGTFKIAAARRRRLPPHRFRHPDLAIHAGQRLTVRYDPETLDSVYVYDPKGRLLCQADRIEPVRFDDVGAARIIHQTERARHRAAEAELCAVEQDEP